MVGTNAIPAKLDIFGWNRRTEARQQVGGGAEGGGAPLPPRRTTPSLFRLHLFLSSPPSRFSLRRWEIHWRLTLIAWLRRLWQSRLLLL